MTVKNVETLGRCCQCGMCRVVCNNITLTETDTQEQGGNEKPNSRDYSPMAKDPARCGKCKAKRCLEICPSNNHIPLPGADAEIETGVVKRVVAGHAVDKDIQIRAASGGFITAFLRFLLENRKVDAVIAVAKDEQNPRQGRFKLIRNVEELKNTASSIYSMIPFPEDVAEFVRKNRDERLVFIGRPCQMRAMSKARQQIPRLEKNIVLTISVFCAWSISRKGVDFLMNMSGVGNEEPVKDMCYRDGIWPGNFSVTLEEGKKSFPYSGQDHYKGVYYYPTLTSFIPDECTHCSDVLAGQADIAVGDAWKLGLIPASHGYSLVVCRSEKAEELIFKSGFVGESFAIDKECTVQDLRDSQGSTVQLKQSGVLPPKKGSPGKDQSLFLFSMFDKVVRFFIRLKLEKSIFKFLFSIYLRIIWKRSKTKK